MSEEKLRAIRDAITKNTHNTSDLNVLADRLAGRSCPSRTTGSGGCCGGGDEITAKIAESISVNWRRYLAIIVVFLAALGANDWYKKHQTEVAEEASAAFYNIQAAFDSLSNEDFDANKVFANLALDFRDTEKSSAHKNLAVLYSAIFKLQDNKVDEALNILDDYFKFKTPAKKELTEPLKGKKTSVDGLINEVAEMVYIRALMSKPNADIKDARARLRQLIYRSQIVTAAAFTLYSSTAAPGNETEAVVDMANALKIKRPELRLE